ncbi:hypothetical protein [Pacificibacter marinus]|uniref:hypothetical protein n=1 Tax=Pacificibacter marinus TaxID=658057 RepID=UPI001C07EB98|nr:hypothetical protein [Pacificibacter marinus]MBU2867013.1 hypothetical protein [Pacificibacter marinus]
MCIPAVGTAFASMLAGGGAATAAGATAAATTGATLATYGTYLAAAGSLLNGINQSRAAKANAKLIENQRIEEKTLTAQKDSRARRQFQVQMSKQVAELAERGVTLDSPTAVLLGQEAAQEMSFQSQSIRATGQATDRELSASASAYRSQAFSSFLSGTTKAAGTLLTAAPDLWPNLGGEDAYV